MSSRYGQVSVLVVPACVWLARSSAGVATGLQFSIPKRRSISIMYPLWVSVILFSPWFILSPKQSAVKPRFLISNSSFKPRLTFAIHFKSSDVMRILSTYINSSRTSVPRCAKYKHGSPLVGLRWRLLSFLPNLECHWRPDWWSP